MSDIELACHVAPWGQNLINALSDIESAGFRGLEMTLDVVEQFEDRVGVFAEILEQHHLQLIAITAGGMIWPGMNLDEEVERNLNTARFLRSAGARLLTLFPPRPNPEKPIENELDLLPAATAYGEIARRTLELDVQTCLHPEAGTHGPDPGLLQKFIEMADPEALKVCVDSGFLTEARVKPAQFVKEHRRRLGLVHLRDVAKGTKRRRTPQGSKEPQRPVTCELGKGDADLVGLVGQLLRQEYTGWATIEFDPAGAKPLGDIAKACHRYAEQNLDLVL